MDKSLSIGVFDSGLGGLTVLSELVKSLPSEKFIYLGDTARVPYGSRSKKIIQKYSLEDVDFLLKYKVKLVVIACNTASAYAEDLIKKHYPSLPVLGVIQPGVKALCALENCSKVGILGTRSTIKSQAYEKLILNKKQKIEIYSQACPLFVPLVEEGLLEGQITELVIKKYLTKLIEKKVDTFVLGCTHYPLLKPCIQKVYPHLRLIDSSQETAIAVKALLLKKKLLSNFRREENKGKVFLYFTDMSQSQRNEKEIQKFLRGVFYHSLEEVQS